MRTGLLETVMTRRYGPPINAIVDGLPAKGWHPDDVDYDTVLYTGMKWHGWLGTRFASLKEIYGNAIGGFLMKNTLKIAVLAPREIYGLWNIDDLRMQPEVQHALTMDPAIDYFMDEDNVFFYGIKKGELYVYDSETDELDSLGPIEQALETVLDELEAARRDVRGPEWSR